MNWLLKLRVKLRVLGVSLPLVNERKLQKNSAYYYYSWYNCMIWVKFSCIPNVVQACSAPGFDILISEDNILLRLLALATMWYLMRNNYSWFFMWQSWPIIINLIRLYEFKHEIISRLIHISSFHLASWPSRVLPSRSMRFSTVVPSYSYCSG